MTIMKIAIITLKINNIKSKIVKEIYQVIHHLMLFKIALILRKVNTTIKLIKVLNITNLLLRVDNIREIKIRSNNMILMINHNTMTSTTYQEEIRSIISRGSIVSLIRVEEDMNQI